MMDANGSSCKNCVNKSCTPAFETCSGLTPPAKATLEAATDACKDAADQKVWNGVGKTQFQSDLSACGHQCLGTASCTAKCIEKKGYTEACSSCFGDLVGCTKDNCMFDCMLDASGSSCKSCVDKSCTPAFETCSGLTPPTKAELGAATDACKDAADQKIWNGVGKTDFEKDLSACGNQCLGGASCTTACIKKKAGYTEACSSCFGGLVGCTKDNCMFDCMMDANGSSCKNCVNKSCTPAFKTCSGP